jgi:uncharacterized membrane protein
MIIIEVLQVLSIIFLGLFAGLMLSLITIVEKHWRDMDQATYSVEFKRFLKLAKGDPLITLLTLGSFILPICLGIIELFSNNLVNATIFLLGGIVFFCGAFLVTIFLNLPLYKKVSLWNSEIARNELASVKLRFFRLNLIRFFTTLIALIIILIGSTI